MLPLKNSLIKVSLFAGMVLLFSLSLHYFLDAQMKQLKYEDAGVWNQISQGGIDADVVIMGSSRAATHIDPAHISETAHKSCFNLGMMGHNFYIENARYYYYLQHNRAPQIIILSLDYESLQRRSDLFNHTQFLAYLDDSIIAQATKAYNGFSKYDYIIPLLKYVGERTLIFSLVHNYFSPERNKPDRVNGFFARDLKWNAEVDRVLDTLQAYSVVPDSPSLAAFESFLHDTKAKNIQVVFVHSPTHLLGQHKVVNRKEIIALYQKYALQFSIPFFDYAADSMCSQKAYFLNATHLNKNGAALFTRKLTIDMQREGILPLLDTTKK
jgi:hypothetical protein